MQVFLALRHFEWVRYGTQKYMWGFPTQGFSETRRDKEVFHPLIKTAAGAPREDAARR